MKTKIYCETSIKGAHSFFMINNGQEYYLFSQDYRKGVQEYYSRGVSLDEAINFAKSRKDNAIRRTMSKIPMYVKYIEKEYGKEVLEQTKRKNRYNNIVKCA